MTLLNQIADRLSYPGRASRRVWVTEGRVHLELRGLGSPGSTTVAKAARTALEQHPGVTWTEMDELRQRIVVGFSPDRVGSDEIEEILVAAEAAAGVSDARFGVDRPEHPADLEPVARHMLALGADVAGLGLVGFGRLLRSTPLPVEAASIVTLVDNEPRIRRFLESHIGTAATDLGLAVTNAVGQGLTQGPFGVVVDGIHRGNLLAEATARRRAWARAEEQRFGGRSRTQAPAHDRHDGSRPAGEPDGSRSYALPPSADGERPVPLPGGPVEIFADRSALAGIGGAALTFAGTRSARRAAAALIAGVPKAARLGREAFASHVDRALCARDLVVLDASALRRLDRVDTVVIDASLVHTGEHAVGGVRLLDDADALEVQRHLAVMFDPVSPLSPRTRGRWTLGPVSAAERRRLAIRRARKDLGATEVLVLRAGGQPVAVARVDPELSMAVAHIVRSARRQGHMVAIAGGDARLVAECGADIAIDGGTGLVEAIESLQRDGCVVALIAPGGPAHVAPLGAADVGLELPSLDGGAWAGDIVLNEARDAALVIDAIGAARQVSRQSVALSASGSGIGGLLALSGTPGQAAGRASSAVNLAALLSIINGIRAAAYLDRHGGRVGADPVRWHQMEINQVSARLTSTPAGLSEHDAGRRRHEAVGAVGAWSSFARSVVDELANPMTPVLIGGAAASAAVGSLADGGLVAGVTAVNALVGGVQRFGAERAIRALSLVSAAAVTVRRPDGLLTESADRLVPGDVVILRSGDAVPADCRVLETTNLEVDESPLTGESDTVGKDAAPTFSSVLAERTSMLYEGTTVAAGEVTAMVVAVRENTTASTMAADSGEVAVSGGVEARLSKLTALTLPVAAAGGGAVMGFGLLRGHGVNRSVGSAVALAVAAVPEGLPLLATMAQLASARRLSGRQALVRNPRAIEALGRVRVLCTDKTGTLTEGRIRLRRVSDGVDDVGLADLHERYRDALAAGLRASPVADADEQLPHLTDRAVVDGAERCGIDLAAGAPGWTRRCELPFEPARGYHAVTGTVAAPGRRAMSGVAGEESNALVEAGGPPSSGGAPGPSGLLSVKGAPEVLIPRCTLWRHAGGTVPVDSAARRQLDHEVDRLARQGLRVLAVAEGPCKDPDVLTDDTVGGLTLLGFLVLSDPVRATAAQAVKGLRSAGVDVVMVTGDHPSTAEGIAVELGILNGQRVVTGSEMQSMSDRQLDAAITGISVFARVTPADKVRIVFALQRRGQAVAMTGDGANDAPAIRLADVGIALGAQATPAARRAADLVVTDERIETIVDAIIEGRAMWASVREALAILLGGNLGEVAFTVAATAVTGESPLSARQLLAVNLLTDVAPALAIAVRPPTGRSPEALLAEGPDISLGRSLEQAIAVRAASTALGAGTAWTIARLTGRRKRASTTALVALVGSQLGQTVTSGGIDPVVLLAGGGSAVLLAAIVQTPGISQFFGCTPLGPVAWATALGSATLATAASVLSSRALPATARLELSAVSSPLDSPARDRDEPGDPRGAPEGAAILARIDDLARRALSS